MTEIFKNLLLCSVKVFLHHSLYQPQFVNTQPPAHRLCSREKILKLRVKQQKKTFCSKLKDVRTYWQHNQWSRVYNNGVRVPQQVPPSEEEVHEIPFMHCQTWRERLLKNLDKLTCFEMRVSIRCCKKYVTSFRRKKQIVGTAHKDCSSIAQVCSPVCLQ